MENLGQLIDVLQNPQTKERQDILLEAAKFCLKERLFYAAVGLINRIEQHFEVDASELEKFRDDLKVAVKEKKGWRFELD